MIEIIAQVSAGKLIVFPSPEEACQLISCCLFMHQQIKKKSLRLFKQILMGVPLHSICA